MATTQQRGGAISESTWEPKLQRWSVGPGKTEEEKMNHAVAGIAGAIKSSPKFASSDVDIIATGYYANRTHIPKIEGRRATGLNDEYWTDRNSSGKFTFREHAPRVAQTFEQATTLAYGAPRPVGILDGLRRSGVNPAGLLECAWRGVRHECCSGGPEPATYCVCEARVPARSPSAPFLVRVSGSPRRFSSAVGAIKRSSAGPPPSGIVPTARRSSNVRVADGR